MAPQTLRTLLEMDQKKLAFESSLNESQKQLVSVILTDGTPIFEQKKPMSKEMASGTREELEKWLTQTHQGLIQEMEFIFSTSHKILQNPTAHICFAMGVILLSRGFYNDALLHFQKATDLEPEDLQAAKHYGITMILKGDFENARYVLNYILESGSAFADIHYYLGNTYLFQRQYEKASTYYEEALRINPQYADAHLRLATCLVGAIAGENLNLVESTIQGFAEEALREAQSAMDCNPKIVSGTLLSGISNVKQKKYQMALKNFTEARPKYVPKTGSELVYFYTLKLLYGEKGVSNQETEEYVRQLEQLVEANPTYVDLRLHYGMANLMKSNFLVHRSLREVNKALEGNPNFHKAKNTVELINDIYRKMLQAVKSVYHSGGR